MEDLIGKKFNKLLVIKEVGVKVEYGTKRTFWLCQCDCGNMIEISRHNLTSSNKKSCGCLKTEKSSNWGKLSISNIRQLGSDALTKHGLRNSRLYNIWFGIKRRCFDFNNKDFKSYGGRGITMCDEWKNDVKCFYDWAIKNGYLETLTIDRIDNDGNYEPNNCRWITKSENSKKRHIDRRIKNGSKRH